MKTLIAATVFALSTGSAMAGSYEQFGGPELHSDLISQSVQSRGNSGSAVFAYERAMGSVELYPTLYQELGDGPDVRPHVSGEAFVDHNTFSEIYVTG